MGKGQRVRAARAAEKEEKKVLLAKKAKKAKATKIATSIIAAVLAVCILGGVIYHTVYSTAYNKGTIQRDTIVLQSENYKVDAAMMSYFFYTQYNNFANTYSTMLSSIGLDTAKSLKKQKSVFGDDQTWHEYFATQAGSQAKELVYLAEMAIKDGMSLNEEDKKSAQETIDAYYEAAKENKMDEKKFLSAVFGTGVNENDVRKCLELSLLADKYREKYVDSLDYSDADLEAFYKENIDTYRYVDYYTYAVEAADNEDKSTFAAAEKRAKELAAVKSPDEFSAWVEKDFRAENPISDDYKEDELKEDLDSALSGLKRTQVTFVKDDEASKWLFNTGKVGETYIADDKAGTYTVYFLTATPYRDESTTRTIRDIILTTENYKKDELKTTADKIVEEMKKAGLTEETFKKYAAEYSENTASSANGGLCENYKQSSYEGTIGDWAFDAKRQAGDFEAFAIEDGYAICYYVGEGIAAWKSDCIADKQDADYQKSYEEWTKNITLTENEKGYNKIPDNI